MQSLVEKFKAARRVSVPLVAVQTPDPAATIKELCGSAAGNANKTAFVCWDVLQGFCEPPGMKFGLADDLKGNSDDSVMSLAGFLNKVRKLPERCVAFMLMADRFWGDAQQAAVVIQGIWNLRDIFKANGRMLVMLSGGGSLPTELANDVLVLDEPLPTAEQLGGIVDTLAKEARKADPNFPLDDQAKSAAVARVRGLSAFTAEQAIAMSLRKSGLDLDDLWDRKRKLIQQTAGLSVYDGPETFADIGGCENIKSFLKRVIGGRTKPNVVVFIDEIEKAMAGSTGDTSGVSQGIHQALLTEMQDTNARGVIFLGPPGAAKSCVAKATGKEGGMMTVAFDLNGLKGSLVGESEKNTRAALKTIRAVSDEQTLWIATCNGLDAISVELRRRFGLGTFFFDLPDAAERTAIWKIYLKKYQIPKVEKLPDDTGWTGAEIFRCCNLAWELRCPLIEAAGYIVPVSKSAGEKIERLRKEASGKFISASHAGVYGFREPEVATRTLDLAD